MTEPPLPEAEKGAYPAYPQIANVLKLSEKTVKNYVSQIYSKLHVERRSQASRLATERRMRKQG